MTGWGFFPVEFNNERFRAALHLTKKRVPMPTKKAAKSGSHRNSHGKRKWSAAVASDSTHPREGLFNKDAKTIARELASKKVSPKGPSSGMRMLTFYMNRAGKNLPASRLKVLENAKKLLHERIAAAKDRDKTKRKETSQHGKKAA
jgi:tRNA(adenine34) deaminase